MQSGFFVVHPKAMTAFLEKEHSRAGYLICEQRLVKQHAIFYQHYFVIGIVHQKSRRCPVGHLQLITELKCCGAQAVCSWKDVYFTATIQSLHAYMLWFAVE